jgi:methylated-DNA-[protein]-cysteine S-methyltransferase
MAEQSETRHHLFDTAMGVCGISWNSRGLWGVQLPERASEMTERRLVQKSGSAGPDTPPGEMRAVVDAIRAYLDGNTVDFSAVALDLEGVDGRRRRIYEALRGIGFGCTSTYGELARSIGLDGWEGARDVGEAMAGNPMPIVIPCHRVLAAGGKLGGFSAYGGTVTKQKLLALEGVGLPGEAARLPGL